MLLLFLATFTPQCCIPKSKSSRAPYVVMFFLVVVAALVLRFAQGTSINLKITEMNICDGERCAGFGASYRLSFALFAFYFLMGLVCLCATKVASVDLGYWGFKIVLLAGLIVGFWFIPNDFYNKAYLPVSLHASLLRNSLHYLFASFCFSSSFLFFTHTHA